MVTTARALALRRAGVDQALLDVIGSEKTGYASVYHLPDGPRLLEQSFISGGSGTNPWFAYSGGLHFGRFAGETMR